MDVRSLFRLRALVNELLKEGKIDSHTRVNIEMSRGLNDYNKRRAIELLQRENEKKRAEYRNDIRSYFQAQGINATGCAGSRPLKTFPKSISVISAADTMV